MSYFISHISEDKCHNTDQLSCVLNVQLFAFSPHFFRTEVAEMTGAANEEC